MRKQTLQVFENIPLAPLTTLGVGGNARFFCEVTNLPELSEAVTFAQDRQIPWRVMGGGSNVMVPDAGYTGLAIMIKLRGCHVVSETAQAVQLYVQAGELFDEIVAYTTKQGWWGLENLSHIPGLVGALPIQNVGAYGVEAGQVIASVDVYNAATDLVEIFDATSCEFGYRDSIFKREYAKDLVVTAVTFVLSKTPKPNLNYGDLRTLRFEDCTSQIIRDHVLAIRKNKFPDWNVVGTAGSFFKNPILPIADVLELKKVYPNVPTYEYSASHQKVSLGYILDVICGMRGVRVGNVGLYENQALVLVAYPGATSYEVDTFAKMVAEKVYVKTKIIIEREVCVF